LIPYSIIWLWPFWLS